MSPLDHPDRHHLNAATGWLELGNLDESARELAAISADNLWHPEVLDLRWQLLAGKKDWSAALDIARLQTRTVPFAPSGWIQQSFALHELQRTQEAFNELVQVVERFADVGTIPYNLACYSCRLGRLDDAKQWLRRACKIQGRKETLDVAASDPDLAEIRGELKSLREPV